MSERISDERLDSFKACANMSKKTEIDSIILIEIIDELISLREQRIKDNLDIAHYLALFSALKGQVDILRSQRQRLNKVHKLVQFILDKYDTDTDYATKKYLQDAIDSLDALLKDLEELEECQRPIFNQVALLKKLEDELENE